MRPSANLERLYPYAFLMYGLLFTAVMIWKLPPFMGPDELNHFKRANLIARGQLIGQRLNLGGTVIAGGPSEASINQAESFYHPLEFQPDRHVDPASADQARSVPWGSAVTDQSFENTAVYPPFFYLPQALAIAIGKAIGASVVGTLQMARIANALLCLAIGFFAVRLSGRYGLALLTVLLLPMVMALSASVTQDGALIATTALAAAFLLRGFVEGRPMSKQEAIGAGICLCLVGMAKPPYVLLSLLPLAVPAEKPRWRWVASGAAIGIAVSWHLFIAAKVATPFVRPDAVINPAGQVNYLMHHPSAPFSVFAGTIRHSLGEYVAQMIGVLGWLDTLLPKPYYLVAITAVLASVFVQVFGKGLVTRRLIAILIVLTITKLAIFFGFYITYTPVGSAVIDGVQGRYLLPLLAMLPLAFAGPSKGPKGRGREAVSIALLAFPLVSLAIVFHALQVRYW